MFPRFYVITGIQKEVKEKFLNFFWTNKSSLSVAEVSTPIWTFLAKKIDISHSSCFIALFLLIVLV